MRARCWCAISLALLGCAPTDPPGPDETRGIACAVGRALGVDSEPPLIRWVVTSGGWGARGCHGFAEPRAGAECVRGVYVPGVEVVVAWDRDTDVRASDTSLAHELAHWSVDVTGRWAADGDHGPAWAGDARRAGVVVRAGE